MTGASDDIAGGPSGDLDPRAGEIPERAAAMAPGRVNLLGEHTDYNDGLALPLALTLGVRAHATRLAGAVMRARALDLGEEDEFPVEDPRPSPGWRAFVRGITAELRRAGVAVPGVELLIAGDLPSGGGLSSSAALELAVCLTLLTLAGPSGAHLLMDPVAIARLCSRVERDWAGAETGLLDQLASLLGRRGHAVLIDFRGPRTRRVPLRLGGHRLVMLDSGDRRNLTDSGYNDRRRECLEACRRLGVASLRDVAPEALGALPEPLGRRVRHVLSENERVRRAVEALNEGDPAELGRLLDASHMSLHEDFEVSTPAVEGAVARLRGAGALGARLVGGGFGGHVLALMPPGVELPAGAVPVIAGEGARLIRPPEPGLSLAHAL